MVAPTVFINHYSMLRVRREATVGDIEKAHHQHSLEVHPNKHPAHQSIHWRKIQMKMNVAKDLLMDPHKRASYDRIWAKQLKMYFESGWEGKPSRVYKPPQPPQNLLYVIAPPAATREAIEADIDRLIAANRKNTAEGYAEMQKIVDDIKARVAESLACLESEDKVEAGNGKANAGGRASRSKYRSKKSPRADN